MTSLVVLLQRLVALMMAIISFLGIKTKTVDVELYANPTSGYSWEYSFDKNGVITLSETYYLPDTSAILSGGGGTQKFVFRAVGSGTVNVTFKYVKDFDNDVASTYVYTYTVDDSGEIILNNVQ